MNRPTPPSRAVRLVQSLLLALVPITCVFGLYELIEQLWLRELSLEGRHHLHLVRDAIAALSAVVVVAWFISGSPSKSRRALAMRRARRKIIRPRRPERRTPGPARPGRC